MSLSKIYNNYDCDKLSEEEIYKLFKKANRLLN